MHVCLIISILINAIDDNLQLAYAAFSLGPDNLLLGFAVDWSVHQHLLAAVRRLPESINIITSITDSNNSTLIKCPTLIHNYSLPETPKKAFVSRTDNISHLS